MKKYLTMKVMFTYAGRCYNTYIQNKYNIEDTG